MPGGRPITTFKEYPKINQAYSNLRDVMRIIYNKWNLENPDNKFVSLDPNLMAYMHYCIPDKIQPTDLNPKATSVLTRFKKILYSILEDPNIFFNDENYLLTLNKTNNLKVFWERLTADKIDNPSITPYVIPGSGTKFKNLYDAGFIDPGTRIILRVNGRDYETLVNSTGKVEITIDGKPMTFTSPSEAADSNGLNIAGFNQWRLAYVLTTDGKRILLDDYRNRFESEKPFPAHFDSPLLNTKNHTNTEPVEPAEDNDFYEGSLMRITTKVWERSIEARQACIAYHGCKCAICGFDFGMFYGSKAAGFIHVHHIDKLSDTSGSRKVDPVKDLIPLCPNCHSVVHLLNDPYSIEDIIEMIKQRKSIPALYFNFPKLAFKQLSPIL